MRVPLPRGARVVKRVLPRSLLGRSVLMVLVPLILAQVVALWFFYVTHLDVVSRRFASSVAGEIASTIDQLDRAASDADRIWVLGNAWTELELAMRVQPGARLAPSRAPVLLANAGLKAALEERLQRPFTLDWVTDPNSVLIQVQMHDGVLTVFAPRKRIYTGTIYLFAPWALGTSLLAGGISVLFLRNQVRGIRRLARAAEAFGMGRDSGPIRPEGATEVRLAATAFNRMQERIGRFLQQRTEMLAGVSHDLRTPLTRLRLALAMLPAAGALQEEVSGMTSDVEEMERMIGGYLAFARGEGTEQAQPTDLAAMLEDVAARARRAGASIDLSAAPDVIVALRPDAVRRAVTNLVDNARRHARQVALASRRLGERAVLVTVDDDGPGIPAARREDMFRPFESGTAGHTGLGLTIARDIVRAHGGDIVLEDSPLGGLRARIQLPV